MSKVVNMKLSVIFLSSLLFSVISSADTVDAKQALKASLLQLKSYQADFEQTVVDIDKTVLQQAKGILFLQQPNKLYWELLSPNESTLIADGQTLWNIDPFLEQVVAYSQSSAIDNNPLILLSDPNSSDWQNFNVTAEKNVFVITPIQSSGSIDKLRLVFSSNNQMIELQTTDVQQQVSTLLFSNISINPKLAADKFTFSLPKGYELDDQRAL